MSIDLKQLVIDSIDRLGYDAAAEKYSVHRNTIVNWMKGKASPGYEALQLAYNEHQGTCTVKEEMAQWEGMKLIVAMPVHRTIEASTVHMLMANYSKFDKGKIGFTITQGVTLLEDARNSLVDRFLKSDAERIVFIDDDILAPCGSAAIFNGYYGVDIPEKFASRVLLNELWNADKDIVGGLYFGRNSRGVAQYSEAFQSKEEDKRAHSLEFDGLQETKWVGTGAMMVKREVFIKIREMAPELWPTTVPRQPNMPHGWFNRLNADTGEDVSLCARARECGFKVYVHKGAVCGHTGPMIFGPHNTAGRAE
jgi:hypothetical protein